MRILGCILVLMMLGKNIFADHLRVNPGVSISVASSGQADIELTLSWANSWCNHCNHDAVYVFGKYQIVEKGIWEHVFLEEAEESHAVSAGYAIQVVNGGRGAFVYRTTEEQGEATVNLRLKWKLQGNAAGPLTAEQINAGKVLLSMQGIEMVYVPTAPFYAGDGVSPESFQSSYFGILPAKYDIIGTNSSFVYSASANPTFVNHPADRLDWAIYNSANRHDWWCGTFPGWWQVDFKTPKKIMYFGVATVCWHPIPPVPATTWYLEGSGNGTAWEEVWSGGPEYWGQSAISYPLQKAIRVKAPGEYRYYRIRFVDTKRVGYWNNVHIANIGMTETDLAAVDLQGPLLQDGFLKKIPEDYPNGVYGFYTMKYELTQEQYVTFLNQLPRQAQYTRTIGGLLDGLEEGDYVYGPDPKKASFRNGIIIQERRLNSGQPYLFACNLNPDNAPNSLDDGQTVACNYLSPADLLAYAEWCGLRPLSELEYEKMARGHYPFKATAKDYPWGSMMPQKGSNWKEQGNEKEQAQNGNVNAGNSLEGPARAGAFVRENDARRESGNSFYGVSDLMGNLAEIYVNTEIYGRQQKRQAHGKGEVKENGSHMTERLYWPTEAEAYGIRGGAFHSGLNHLSISDRSQSCGYFQQLTDRHPEVGGRLGYTCEPQQKTAGLTLANGLVSGGVVVYDTVCDASTYVIRGEKSGNQYLWFKSTDDGISWQLLEGQNQADLSLARLTDGFEEYTVHKYLYKRISYNWDAVEESGVVGLIINKGFRMNSLRDTIQPCMASRDLIATTLLPATFAWTCKETGKVLKPDRVTGNSSSYHVRLADLKRTEEERLSGNYVIQVEALLAGRCREQINLDITVLPYTSSPFSQKVLAYAYNNNDAYQVPCRWTGEDKQKWMLLTRDHGTLSMDDTTGILRGISTNYVKDIVVGAVCKEFPDQVHQVVLREKYREFGYSATGKEIYLPAGPYTMECWGAQGGQYSSGYAGANGGYTKGTLNLADSRTFYVYVGQQGHSYSANHSNPAPFNGGGEGYNGGGDGGGASDIRLEGGEWNNVLSLRSRIMVAAGGGGSDLQSCGGTGGGITGYNAIYSQSANPGFGATQTATGARPGTQLTGGFGYGGGAGTAMDGGGGGAGWYGGSSGNNGHDGGGGGSSYISGYPLCKSVDKEGNPVSHSVHFSGLKFSRTLMIAGYRSGQGLVRITAEDTAPVEDHTVKTIKNFGTYRAWSDGTFAHSAEEYRHPEGNCRYEGDTGDGIYRIDPDGEAGSQQPFDVYCDMATDGGGWTLIVAQYEHDPVKNWNEGIQADYDPTLATKKGFALNSAQIPPHTYVGFGKDLNPTSVGYSQMAYSVGDMGVFMVKNLKNGYNYQVHRNAGGFFNAHDPESTYGNYAGWNNTPTYDVVNNNVPADHYNYSWAYSPNHTIPSARGHNLLGFVPYGEGYPTESYAWTVWVK